MTDRILDLSRQADYLWALLPEIVLALLAMTVLLADVLEKGNRSRPSKPWVAWLALGSVAATFAVNGVYLAISLGAHPFTERFGPGGPGMVAMDGFRFTVNAIFLVAAFMAILLSMGYLDRRGINRGEFHALVLFAVLGMMLLSASADLMLLFIGLEVMSVAIYVLVGFDRMDPRSSEGSLKYFLLGAFASAFFLYGIALVFGATGTTNLRVLAGEIGAGQPGAMLTAGLALLLVGFAFKVAAIPFHTWAPDAYDGAPTPVTALMATGVKAAAFAAFIRVLVVAFGDIPEVWQGTLFLLAAATMIGGNLIALTQGSVKRMLAYSSIAHAGYLLAAVIVGLHGGAGAFVFYLLVYTLMTAGAFGIVIANSRDGQERVTLEEYAGFAKQQPLLAALFAIFLLSLAGFPLTAGFLGKLYILRGLVENGFTSLAVILVLASLVSYFYYLRVVVVMYMRPAHTEDEHRDAWLPRPALVGVTTAAALVVLLFFTAGVPWREGVPGGPRTLLGVAATAESRLHHWRTEAQRELRTRWVEEGRQATR
jgi:NADH-quinone oxidoreductase subunit N